MVKSVDHGAVSSTATVAYDTVKGGVKGMAVVGLIGAVVFGAAAAGVAALVAAAAGAIGIGVGVGAAALVAGAIGAVVGGLGSAVSGGGLLGATVGAVAGLFGGVGRVKNEKAAFVNREGTIRESMQAREQAIAQQAFAMGAQAGQQSVVAELQKYQEMQIRSQMAQAAGQKPVVGGHTANIVEKRVQQQAAGTQPQVA
jgi:hypothetical protein